MGAYVGLDVHSKKSVYVVQDGRGREKGRGEVPTDREGFEELRRRCGLEEGTVVALESGTVAFYAARQLRAVGLRPMVIDAHEVRSKAHRPRQKSDERDAAELCHGVRTGMYRSIVHVPSERVLLMRETLSRRRHFVRLRTGQVLAVKRLLRSAGLRELARRSLSTGRAWGKLLDELKQQEASLRFARLHLAAWQAAGQQIEQLEQDLERQLERFGDDVRRLKTIPGFGTIVAATVMAVLSEADRFPSSKHASSYAGLTPRMGHSGDQKRDGHITKQGSGELRAMLCEAAHQAARKTSPLYPLFVRQVARVGYRKAITALAHRLCRVAWALLRHGGQFDPRRLGIEPGDFRLTTRRTYRLSKVTRRR